MPIVRAVLPALLAFALLFSVVTQPAETFVFLGGLILTLTTASSIIFFAFVLLSLAFGLESTSARHLAPAAPVHVHRQARDQRGA
ncbi:hypothetical protein ABLE93_11810 [Xanthobacter sp. KR7-65]|uniref:hypothetical protein n=1 Tax=Xanthobacter sp. KR7-65 TaxID=3156612 RepID=UPI0032B46255